MTSESLKSYISANIADKDIYEHYFEPINLNKKYISPFKKEVNPSLSFFYRGDGVLIHNDFSHSKGDCFIFVKNLFGISYRETLFKIVQDFSGQFNNSKRINPQSNVKIAHKVPKIDFLRQDYNEIDLQYWGQFGYTKEWLRFFNIISVKDLYIDDKWIPSSRKNPIYCYLFRYNNKIYKKIYQPFKEKHLRFTSDLNGVSNKIWQGENQIDYSNNNLLIITKSLKDAGAIKINLNIESIAPQSETSTWDINRIDYYKSQFKKIILYFDNDSTGIMKAKEYSELYNIPFVYNDETVGKDFTDMIIKNNVIFAKNYLIQKL